MRRIELIEPDATEADDLEGQRTYEHPQGRHHAGRGRQYDLRNLQLLRNADCVQGPRSAESDHAAAAVIYAALRSMDPEGARDVFVDHFMHAPCRAQRAQLEQSADSARHRELARLRVYGHASTQKELGVKVTQHQIGVRQCGLLAAKPIAGRTRVSTCAAGADTDKATLVDCGYAAAAGADFDHVNHRDAHEQA